MPRQMKKLLDDRLFMLVTTEGQLNFTLVIAPKLTTSMTLEESPRNEPMEH